MSWNASEWLLDRHVVNGSGEHPALRTADGPAISYAQLLTRVESMAAGLSVICSFLRARLIS